MLLARQHNRGNSARLHPARAPPPFRVTTVSCLGLHFFLRLQDPNPNISKLPWTSLEEEKTFKVVVGGAECKRRERQRRWGERNYYL